MMPTPAELLRRLADRGQPRGAGAVFEAASRRRTVTPRVVLAAAAVVAVVGGVIGLGALDDGTARVTTPDRAEVASPSPSVPETLGVPDRLDPDAVEAGSSTTSTSTTAAAGGPGGGEVIGVGEGAAVRVALQAHDSCGSVLDRLQTLGLEAVGPYGFDSGVIAYAEPATADRQTEGAASAPAADSGAAHSASNVQEAGVDEPDLVKTDGEVIVAIARQRIQLVSVADRALLSHVDLDVHPMGLFLTGDTVVVIGAADWSQEKRGPETPVVLVDVSDPRAPALRSTTWFEGFLRTARLQAGVVRLVMGDAPRFVWAQPEDGSDEARAEAEAENRRRVADSELDVWLPDYRTLDAGGNVVAGGPVTACSTTYTPTEESGFDTTTVVTLDPETGGIDPGTGVAATPHVVYASASSLYVVSSACCEGDRPQPTSDIHRFDLRDPARAPYTSSGSVVGLPINQFALSELDGNLRIATTFLTRTAERPESDDRIAPRDDTDNAIWVLAEDGDRLELIGQVTGLGEEGERIFSVRYHGDFGYVVTFRQTDPLYVIDLRDPTRPVVRGELHVPGFSTFLQVVGDGRLVGIGRDADDEGRVQGLQVSMFDVSDPTRPARTDRVVYDRGSSLAEHDHLAFLHWAPTDLVAIPFFDFGDAERCQAFAGVLLLGLDGTAIDERARVSHAEHAGSDGGAESGDGQAIVPIFRSLVAGGALVTVSDLGLAFGDLDDGAEQAFVEFAGDGVPVERFGCEPRPEPQPEPEPEPRPVPL